MGCSALCNNVNQQIANINLKENQNFSNENTNCNKAGSSPFNIYSFTKKKTRSYQKDRKVSGLNLPPI